MLIIFCTQLNSLKYSKWLNSSIWPINGTLTGVTTPCQRGPGSNSNEEVLHIFQSSSTEFSPSDSLVSYPEHTLKENIEQAFQSYTNNLLINLFDHRWDSLRYYRSGQSGSASNVNEGYATFSKSLTIRPFNVTTRTLLFRWGEGLTMLQGIESSPPPTGHCIDVLSPYKTKLQQTF